MMTTPRLVAPLLAAVLTAVAAAAAQGGGDVFLGRRAAAASARGDDEFLARRAVYVRWGSRTCPMGSALLYAGFMANAHYTHEGSGFNYLCMHPNPQRPAGAQSGDQNGALLYGVEYEDVGALDMNSHHNKDAACAVCQWQNGGAVYVEWGHGESRDNPSTPTRCSKQEHEAIYTGFVMGTHYTQTKSEHICVDLERATHPTSSDANDDGGLLYTTEMEEGSSNEGAYPHNIEVGCTVCGIPARGVVPGDNFRFDPSFERSVYTRWGSKSCGPDSQLIYEGFIAGEHYTHSGGGANSICMTASGASPPSGYSNENQDGNLLYGTEYQNTGAIDKNHDHDAACAVCEYMRPRQDVYTQWGRQTCTNSHSRVYYGLIMGSHWTQHKSMHLCVDWAREAHSSSETANDDGNLLYTTEMEAGSSDETQYTPNVEVGCATCATGGGGTVFTRWGHTVCPTNSKVLYSGFMASSHYSHSGGGANTLCMHGSGEAPVGADTRDQNGNLLYGMEYENTNAIDKNHDQDAACVVCQLDWWETVYTQWGRSDTCTNGHQTLYKGLIMANFYTQSKGEYVCVDLERAAHPRSSGANDNGGCLYTTEMEQGASDESQYPHNYEVGCSVCVAVSQKDELPFAARVGNAIHGEWVKIRSLHTGQEVTVSYGYERTSGEASSAEETEESSYARMWDMSICHSVSFTAGAGGIEAEVGSEGCATYGGEKADSVAKTTARETSWDVTATQGMEDTFSVPDDLPDGVPQARLIQAQGVHLWQWQWTIKEGAVEGEPEKWYKAKANSHYLYSPNDPSDGQPKRPCCMPGQELGLWYPFNCKSSDGLLPGAENAAHCQVGSPGSSTKRIEAMDTQAVATWLNGLGLKQSYSATWVMNRALDGKAFAELAKIVDESSHSVEVAKYIADLFSVGEAWGDAYKIMAALQEL